MKILPNFRMKEFSCEVPNSEAFPGNFHPPFKASFLSACQKKTKVPCDLLTPVDIIIVILSDESNLL